MPFPPGLRQTLIELAESFTDEADQVDFKSELDLDCDKVLKKMRWAEIVKDVVSLSNSGGGVIVFGCDGHGNPVPVSPSKSGRIDPAEVSQHVRTYTEVPFSEVLIEQIRRKGKRRVGWLIGPVRVPVPFTSRAFFQPNYGYVAPAFFEGQVYFRHGAASEPAHHEDFRHVIDRATEEYRLSIQPMIAAAAPRVIAMTADRTATPGGTLAPELAASTSSISLQTYFGQSIAGQVERNEQRQRRQAKPRQ